MLLETVIGLEIHAELKTNTKIFCSCSTEFGAKPNENTCPICLGIPGTLPVLNEEVVNLAIKAGRAVNCTINNYNKMDRKNYFYPDLTKNYQTSQYDLPMCVNGMVNFTYEGKEVSVRISRIHIEEDAGKLVHLEDEPVSLIDYNRAGVPLVEIVTEPDLRSPGEAAAFMRELKGILEYAEISDCRMEQGSIRCDANISIRTYGQEEYGTKVEIKNINSFREVQKALEKEEKRQKELYQYKEEYKIKQETRRWDAGKGKTLSMRSKEEAHDYRYFPEPDLTPIIIPQEKVDTIEKSLPEMPIEKRARFVKEYGINEKEASIIIGSKVLAGFYEEIVKEGGNPKTASNYILGDLLRLLNANNMEPEYIKISPKNLVDLFKIIEEGKISNTAGKEVFKEMFESNRPVLEIIEEKGLSQISCSDEIEKLVDEVLNNNPKSIEDFKAGKIKAVGFLMGQVMKASKGKANPQVAKQMIEEKLKNK
ncbi:MULTISPECIES: Asp-tRNA(Asn)/Glu-tRNA(Gln) amidotransferase subunit GatB [Terrisporobacter]|uniref:Aspartyl/glutamyl-tRNA(Asn/Gln) amidotransferase subunit B n=2 Tax=Terrisporobacter TaxID=1505652 RepID=A0A0B3W154_9FIRM|nr:MULTISPECIES: Asp-tRNA(Asn)/Glu-tRNA(Gln) amidotransferase subunit GatB [Terrisporobacter]MDO4589056.1 Asp-tRNA(Asn)/Glu-tRNA(Gln) amidotransferase subunit GatB [Fusobacterium sp.]KHS56027.1 glutamyl-tRNA amidotransferase [Terrisporobacter othiniensis]MCC3667992.1 Asp-tRNA(Asn)/Glu-tRNA(Gln) amidotransferase subunit GatB [Terrisporobacter mayombei]MCR1824214.1 Asp-tRNA(Asn)/Glu-tRNA(Gln) amidotransferase subunit GatB [Terrisporobacter muris]MDU6983063.1 Asp-tRNA(Asn)/Glu-tRNA(Gln) amidotran